MARDRIKFLQLPETVDRVSYWADRHTRMVTFKVSEDEFRRIFPQATFREIDEQVGYHARGFGDPEKPPWKEPYDVYAEKGLIYQTKPQPNGAITRILYDRDRSRASMYSAAW